MKPSIALGVGIGQKRAPTGIGVVQIEERREGTRPVHHFVVRHLERLSVGTPYPAIARRLSEIATALRRRGPARLETYVDATGLGEPLVDLLRVEAPNLRPVHPVRFTHGDQRTREGRGIRLGKAHLVSQLQMLLQSARLHLPRTREAEALAADLLDYEIQVDEKADERYGAFRVGPRDDLVTALGLAVQKPACRGRVL